MKILNMKRNQEGITLFEVVAALLVLGITFLLVIAMFNQMGSVNKRTDTKLKTMNYAKMELSSLKAMDLGEGKLTIERIESVLPELALSVNEGTLIKPKWSYTKNGVVYTLMVDLDEEKKGTQNESLKPYLYRAKITAKSLEEKQESSAYTYLEVDAS